VDHRSCALGEHKEPVFRRLVKAKKVVFRRLVKAKEAGGSQNLRVKIKQGSGVQEAGQG